MRERIAGTTGAGGGDAESARAGSTGGQGVAATRLAGQAHRAVARAGNAGPTAAPPGPGPAREALRGTVSGERIQAFSLSETLSGIGRTMAAVAGTAAEAIGLSQAVIVDDATEPGPGQIRRSRFLAQVRATVCETADEELSAVGQSTDGCPYIQYWLGRAAGMPARNLERMIGLYAQPAERTPTGFLTALSQRVRRGVREWIASGRIEGAAPAGAEALAGESVQRKARDPGVPPAPKSDTPAAVRARLGGSGEPLEGGVRARMERAFGTSFSQVRLHRDDRAARVAAEHGALALTVGQDVVMGGGRWRPGTLAGDLLLAHELAHTIQQRGGIGTEPGQSHEDDADRAAARAVLTPGAAAARPGLRTGLAVQGCKPTRKQCPPGMMWGTVANAQSTGAGSFGCTCVYRCIENPQFQPNYARLCPASGCPSVTVVGDEYHFVREGRVETAPVSERARPDERAVGWGGAATPLGEQALCLCPGVDIEGEERTEGSHVEQVALDLTDVAGPAVDIAHGVRARRQRRRGGGGTPVLPETDPTTGTRIPGRRSRLPHPLRERAIAAGFYTRRRAPRLERLLRESDPAIMHALDGILSMPANQARNQRLDRLLDWAEGRPTLPEIIHEGATFGRGGTGSVAEVVGHPGLASKTGAGRAGSEAAAMVQLELAGIPTVYLGERATETGARRLVLRRIDGVGSKDIIGRARRPPDDPARAREYEQYVTQRTIDDLNAIYQRLVDANLNVGDFQFIIRRSDGAVFVNDPTGVTPNSRPSGRITGIIDRFRAILRHRTEGEGN